MNHGSSVTAAATSMIAQLRSGGRGETRAIGTRMTPVSARASGKRKNTGRLSAAAESRNPASTNAPVVRMWIARMTAHMPAVKTNAVHNSVITSAPKYGSGGKSAVAVAAASATSDDASRVVMAYTSRQISTNN